VLLRGDRGVYPAGRLCSRSFRRRKSTALVCRLHAAAYGRDVAAVPCFTDAHAAYIANVYVRAHVLESVNRDRRHKLRHNQRHVHAPIARSYRRSGTKSVVHTFSNLRDLRLQNSCTTFAKSVRNICIYK